MLAGFSARNPELAFQWSTRHLPLPRLRTPPHRHLPPSDPPSAPLGQVLTLGNQTLMDRTGQRRDALVPDLVEEVTEGKCACANRNVGVKVDECGRTEGMGVDTMNRSAAI